MRTLHLETEPVAVNLEVRAPEKRPCTPNRVFHHALPQIPGSAGKRKPRRPGRENRAHFSYASVAGLKFARHCAVFFMPNTRRLISCKGIQSTLLHALNAFFNIPSLL